MVACLGVALASAVTAVPAFASVDVTASPVEGDESLVFVAPEGSTQGVVMPRNTVDHYVHFNIADYPGYSYSDPEWKDEDWSTYVNAQDMGIYRCHLKVFGATSWDGYFLNRTIGGHATLKTGGEHMIDQLVYESGESWARLQAENCGWTGYVAGVWSADGINYGFDTINGD